MNTGPGPRKRLNSRQSPTGLMCGPPHRFRKLSRSILPLRSLSFIDDISLVPEVKHTGEGRGDAGISYRIRMGGEDVSDGNDCLVEVLDQEGNMAGSGTGLSGKICIKNAYLWQPLKPYLYTVKVKAGEDIYELPYGIRTVRIDGSRFLINERPFYFKGYGKHEDTFPGGRGENIPMISLLTKKGFVCCGKVPSSVRKAFQRV